MSYIRKTAQRRIPLIKLDLAQIGYADPRSLRDHLLTKSFCFPPAAEFLAESDAGDFRHHIAFVLALNRSRTIATTSVVSTAFPAVLYLGRIVLRM